MNGVSVLSWISKHFHTQQKLSIKSYLQHKSFHELTCTRASQARKGRYLKVSWICRAVFQNFRFSFRNFDTVKLSNFVARKLWPTNPNHQFGCCVTLQLLCIFFYPQPTRSLRIFSSKLNSYNLWLKEQTMRVGRGRPIFKFKKNSLVKRVPKVKDPKQPIQKLKKSLFLKETCAQIRHCLHLSLGIQF